MQILAKAGEEFPFFNRITPVRVSTTPPSDEEPVEQMTPTTVAPLEFVSRATSAIRSASTRAKRALVELKDDIVHDILSDFGSANAQATQVPASQSQGWALPWGARTVEDRQKEETRRRIRELTKEPSRFLVPAAGRNPSETLSCSGDVERELLVAASIAMEKDSSLQSLRDDLVPRMLPEADFWQRYFNAVRLIELEMFKKYSSINTTSGAFSTPDRECLSYNSSESANSSSADTSNSSWSYTATESGRFISPVRPFNVDDEYPPIAGSQRCASDPLEESGRGGLRCPYGGGIHCLRASCSCSEAGRFSSLGEGVAGGFTKHNIYAREGEVQSSVRRDDSDGEGALGWLRRTLSGASSVSNTAPSEAGDGPGNHEVVHDHLTVEALAQGALLDCDTPTAPNPLIAPLSEAVLPWTVDGMPPSSALQHLHSAYTVAQGYRTWEELAPETEGFAGARWPGLGGLAAVGASFRRQSTGARGRSLSPHRREKEDVRPRDPSPDATSSPLQPVVHVHLLSSLFREERDGTDGLPHANSGEGVSKLLSCFTRSLHGAPPGSFVAELALAMTRLTSVQEMAQLWLEVVAKLRWHFKHGRIIPGVPMDTDHPDLQLCEAMQHLQLINLCMVRRQKRKEQLAKEAEEKKSVEHHEEGSREEGFRRRGVKEVTGTLLLETGEALCIPETQEVALMTESSMREVEEQIMKTGTMGSGCEQLFSDMQAFKAANPGCLLEDFVRWYSPPDWSPVPYSPLTPEPRKDKDFNDPAEEEGNVEGSSSGEEKGQQSTRSGERGSCKHGYLSVRMTFAGNLWQELWGLAEAVPAIEQAPLFDVEEGGRSSLEWLRKVTPSELLEQLFITLVCQGLQSAHSLEEAQKEPLKTSLSECTGFIQAACSRGMGGRKQQLVCTVYDVLETARAATKLGPLLNMPKTLQGAATPSQSCQQQLTPGHVLQGELNSTIRSTADEGSLDDQIQEGGREEERFADICNPAGNSHIATGTNAVLPVDPEVDISEQSRVEESQQTGVVRGEVKVEDLGKGGIAGTVAVDQPAKDGLKGLKMQEVVTAEELIGTAKGSSGLGSGTEGGAALKQAASALFQRIRSAPAISWKSPSVSVAWPTSQGVRAMLQVSSVGRRSQPSQHSEQFPSTTSLSSTEGTEITRVSEQVAIAEKIECRYTHLLQDSNAIPATSGMVLREDFTAREVGIEGEVLSTGLLGSGERPIPEPFPACSMKEKELDNEWVIL